MPEFRIDIKTSADLKAAQDLKRSLEEEVKLTKELGKDSSALEGKLQTVNTAIGSESAGMVRLTEAKKKSSEAAKKLGLETEGASGQIAKLIRHVPGLGGLANVFEKLASGPLGAIAAGLASIAAASGVAKKGIEEFASAQEKVTSLDQALAQSGQLTDDYRERLQGLASELQNLTGVADDKFYEVFTRLTQFGSTEATIRRDTQAVIDLAGVLGGDLNAAADLVSRALQGNFESFSRYGIIVDQTGTQAEKLNKLFTDLALRGGGQLEARNRTLTGQFGQLKNAVSDTFEAVGRGIAKTGIMQRSLEVLTTAFAFWANILGGTIDKVEGLENAAERTTQSIDSQAEATQRLAMHTAAVEVAASAAAEALQDETDALEAQRQASDKLTDANMALEISKIGKLKADGKISETQALEMEVKVRADADKTKFDRAQATRTEKVEAAKKTVSEIDQEFFRRDKSLRDNRTLLVQLEEKERLEKDLANDTKVISALEQRIAELDEADKIIGAKLGTSQIPDNLENTIIRLRLEKVKARRSQTETALTQQAERTPQGVSATDVRQKIAEQEKLRPDESGPDAQLRRDAQKRIRDLEAEKELEEKLFEINRTRFGIEAETKVQRARRNENEERRKAADDRLRNIQSGQPSAAVETSAASGASGGQAVVNVSQAANQANGGLAAMQDAIVDGFMSLGKQGQINAKEIAALSAQIATLDRRQNNQRLS